MVWVGLHIKNPGCIYKIFLITISVFFIVYKTGAQYSQVTHLSGTQTIAGIDVTVVPNGQGASTNISCPLSSPYWIGHDPNINSSGYTFSFSKPATAIIMNFYALNQEETVKVAINGYPYLITSANLSNPPNCGGFLANITNGNLTYNSSNGSGYGQLDIFYCQGINSISFTDYGQGNGIAFSFYFTDSGGVAATANTPLCIGATLNLNAVSTIGAIYNWSGPNGFSDTAQNPVINNVSPITAGNYVVAAITGNCIAKDTIVVVVATPQAYLTDTVTDILAKCKGRNTVLTANLSDYYSWSNDSTSQKFTVIDTGRYQVLEKHLQTNLCIDTNVTLHIFYVEDIAVDTLITTITDTLYKCPGEQLVLHVYPATNYLWSTGDSGNSIIITSSGYYTAIENIHFLSCRESINIHEFHVIDKVYNMHIDLGIDTVVCTDDYILLKTLYTQTIWSNGSTGAGIIVRTPGTYVATLIDSCGNNYTDSVHVYFQECKGFNHCAVTFPSIFSPNQDGRNDNFHPVIYEGGNQYALLIYNRWGEKLFESHDPLVSWDGTYKGQSVNAGSYMYMCTIKCPEQGTKILKGDVLLVR